MPHFKPTGPISLQGSGKKKQVACHCFSRRAFSCSLSLLRLLMLMFNMSHAEHLTRLLQLQLAAAVLICEP